MSDLDITIATIGSPDVVLFTFRAPHVVRIYDMRFFPLDQEVTEAHIEVCLDVPVEHVPVLIEKLQRALRKEKEQKRAQKKETKSETTKRGTTT